MSMNSYILAGALVFSVMFTSVNSVLQCWRCSSDATNGAFCADPFDLDIVSPQQRQWGYVNCTFPYNFNSGPNNNVRPVCKKLVQEIYGKTVVSRSCFLEDANDQPDKCFHDTFPSYVKTLYCRTCSTDGCNSGTNFAPIVTTMLLSFLVPYFLIF